MYEPPETELDQNQMKGRSRRYDIWSMGCIYLEFIIWLLYGFTELEKFNRALALGDNKGFYELDSSKKPKLHKVVEAWVEHMKADRRCPANSALRLLLDHVVNRLLNTDMGSIPTPLNNKWEYGADIDIARELSDELDTQNMDLRPQPDWKFCQRCESLELWRPRCKFSDTLTELKRKAEHCALCLLLFQGIREHSLTEHSTIEFTRVGSSIACNTISEQPIASLYTIPKFESQFHSVQLGPLKLSEPGSDLNLNTISAWIRSCDRNHTCLSKTDTFLPTRVVDVGDKHSNSVRIICFAREHTMSGKYLALSHRWGSPTLHKAFRTLKSNLEDFRQGIQMSALPRTFQHAVQITRSLGLQYIWIDSLCIVQDDLEDWDHESRLMEQVFSSAYATIAATCATGTNDGFLKERLERQCIQMAKGNASYFVCEAIDNVHRDVDQADLNNRGWVLQERALSRRTIHFTKKQCYWECGGGVRCETLTKMNNRKASFLADADFPRSVESYVKGMRIELLQDLYVRYSNLALSFNKDRPVAIRGLERRLINTLNTTGGYGIFDIYLHRCLLWQRGDSYLKMIGLSPGECAPSWSWVSYEGGIKYMDVPYAKVYWADDIETPFKRGVGMFSSNQMTPATLLATGYDVVDLADAELTLDEADCQSSHHFKCVIVGTSKNFQFEESICYVLVVEPIGKQQEGFYRRVGVAKLKRGQISFSPSSIIII
ncbi:heterokaryon incompatibility protein-domain-containing protein [Phaeosphaeriaceae sp. PMI808]|nr:heterokaryon incompatibility protein-domain-containing protein [Phaeosphaeriaceae sp. PMI808]